MSGGNNHRVVVAAPAKINLMLDIVGQDGKGFHLLETVMQAVDLSDLVVIGRRPGEEIRVTCSLPGIPEGEENLAGKAALAFFAAAGIARQGLAVHIDKRIPEQAGLAGGSADAAAVLVGLNSLLETGFSLERLCEIGAGIGADVPFCIRGGLQLATGRGERLSALPPLPPCYIAVAKPEKGMSTREAFALYDSAPERFVHPDNAAMASAIAAGDLRGVGSAMDNLFEQLGAVEEVASVKAAMRRCGALGAVMTGSGSAVVGLFADRENGESCLARLRGSVAGAWLAGPIAKGAHIIHCS